VTSPASPLRDRLLLAAFLAVCILYCLTPMHSSNFFWHVRNGEDILDSGRIRTTDPFTWTARGREWLQQEWLAEVVFALSWRLPGDSWPVILKAAVIAGALLLTVMAARRNGATVSAAVLAALLWGVISHGRWIERPHIFTILFCGLYLFLTARDAGGLRRSLLLFVPLQVLWTNLHAGFLVGWFLLGTWTLRALSEGRRREAFRRGVVLAAALLTSGLHPNGFRSVTYLIDFLSRPLFRESIREWWSPFHPQFQPGHPLSTTAILLTLLLAGTWTLVALRRRGIGRVDAAALLALSVATVTTSRNIDILALAAVAWTAPLLSALRPSRLLPAGCLAAATAVAFTLGVPREFGPPKRLGLGVDWDIYATGLVDFLRENPGLMQARVFNTNEISGYIEYALADSLPLYMDGRCHLYSERLYAEYLLLAAFGDPAAAPRQMEAVGRLGVELALMDWPRNEGSVAYSLARSSEWAPVYWDRLTVAYARVSFLESAGLEDLVLGPFDPLLPLETAEMGPAELPASWLDDLLATASPPMSSETPAIAGITLLAREGLAEEAEELAAGLPEPLRGSTLAALAGAAGEVDDRRLRILRIWSLARIDGPASAREAALASGEEELAGWLGFLDPSAAPPRSPGSPPPLVPEGAWGRVLSGDALPGDVRAARAAALLCCGMGDAAVDTARAASGADSLSPWALAASGGVLALCGHLDEGAALADSALRRSRNPFTLTVRGRIADIAGSTETAVLLFSEALAESPMLHGTRLLRADCLWRLGRTDEAMADYHVLHELGYLPEAMESRYQWGRYFEEGS